MVKLSSPGVYVIEKDVSDYGVAIDSSIVGIVGYASKGPVNKATLVTSPQNLINIFGKPSNAIPGQGLEGAVEILEATNAVYFVRGTTSTALEASAAVPMGACPAVIVSGNSFGVTQNLYLDIQVTDNNGVSKLISAKQVNIPSGTVAATSNQGTALVKAIGNGLDQSHFGSIFDTASQASGYVFGSYAGSGATITVTAYSNSTRTTGVSALFALDENGSPTGSVASSVTASGVTLNSDSTSGVSYLVKSLYPGAGYNGGTTGDGSVSGNSVEITNLGFASFSLEVNEDGAAVEYFKPNFLASGAFIEDLINVGTDNAKSDVIKAYLVSSLNDFTPTKLTSFIGRLSDLGLTNIQGKRGSSAVGAANPRFLKLIDGTYNLGAGTNGTSTDNDTNASALIGDPTVSPKEGIYALDNDTLNISIALVPGFSNQNLQNALVTLAEQSQNFIAIVSPPYGSIDTVQEALDWHNGQSETRTAAINSSYAAIYFPWVRVFSVFDGVDKWMDPAIYAARQMCYTDSVAETWFAPAGFTRGRLTKPNDVEIVLNQGDRDSLYSGGNAINPIVEFPQQGITIFGQRTAQRNPSALDRVNVRRLLILLRKTLLASTQRFTFEPNDVITWQNIKTAAETILDDIRRRRGITDFKVVCDETTNTPARIDRSEVWCKIILIPTKAAEAIVFEINVTSNSAKLGS
jgi:phage tail sheath protein FI